MQSTSGHILPTIIALFSTFALVPILVVILGLIVRHRKDLIKKQSENEENSYEIMNYKLDDYDIGVYVEIN